MVMKNEKFEMHLARVTERGLVLNAQVYTNSNMIKHKWFESARIFGEWELPVLYNEQNPQVLILFDSDNLEVATSVEISLNPSEHLDEYYAKLKLLKKSLGVGEAQS